MNNHTRIIHTALYGDKAFEILDSMRGQLSDGKWENSPGYTKYWMNFNVIRQDDGEIVFVVNTDYSCLYYQRYLENPFRNMTSKEFTSWCARKIKAVIKDELRDRAAALSMDRAEALSAISGWNRRNLHSKSVYLGHSDEKFGQVVSVADIYCIYEALLGRDIGILRYDPQTIINVFGSKRNKEDTAKMTAIASIRKKYAQKREALQQAKNEAMAKLEKDLHDSIVKLTNEENAEIAKVQKF